MTINRAKSNILRAKDEEKREEVVDKIYSKFDRLIEEIVTYYGGSTKDYLKFSKKLYLGSDE